MCSSPKGSSWCFKQARRKEFSRSDYEEHARMMRRASAVYDRIEQEKADRQLIANQTPQATIDKSSLEDKAQVRIFSGIKAFLLQTVF